MFLIMGVNQGEKQLDFAQTFVCPCCGRFGRLEVFFTYTCFSLFFIPLFKWDKRYVVTTSCCHAHCEIDPTLGAKIAKGELSELRPEELHFSCGGDVRKQCHACGYRADAEFSYCPKCGNPL